jgi:hypothetical protein
MYWPKAKDDGPKERAVKLTGNWDEQVLRIGETIPIKKPAQQLIASGVVPGSRANLKLTDDMPT